MAYALALGPRNRAIGLTWWLVGAGGQRLAPLSDSRSVSNRFHFGK